MSDFALWSWAEPCAGGANTSCDSQSSSHRSRSPPLSSAPRPIEAAWQPPFHRGLPTSAGGAPSRPSAGEPWSTGVAVCDTWLREHVKDMQVLNNFTEIPEKNRKSIVLKAMEKPKDNPVAWIAACINNHRTREMERRLLSSASPHQTKATSGIHSPASTAGRQSLTNAMPRARRTRRLGGEDRGGGNVDARLSQEIVCPWCSFCHPQHPCDFTLWPLMAPRCE